MSLHLLSAPPWPVLGQAPCSFSGHLLSKPAPQGRHEMEEKQEEQGVHPEVHILLEASAHETQSWVSWDPRETSANYCELTKQLESEKNLYLLSTCY